MSAIESTHDGKAIVLGTVDGCLSVLAIADPAKENMKQFLETLPSRDQHVSYLYIIYLCIVETFRGTPISPHENTRHEILI